MSGLYPVTLSKREDDDDDNEEDDNRGGIPQGVFLGSEEDRYLEVDDDLEEVIHEQDVSDAVTPGDILPSAAASSSSKKRDREEYEGGVIGVEEPALVSPFNLQKIHNTDFLRLTKKTKDKLGNKVEKNLYGSVDDATQLDEDGKPYAWQQLDGKSVSQVFLEEEEVFYGALEMFHKPLLMLYVKGDYENFEREFESMQDESAKGMNYFKTKGLLIAQKKIHDLKNRLPRARQFTYQDVVKGGLLTGEVLFNRLLILRNFVNKLLPKYKLAKTSTVKDMKPLDRPRFTKATDKLDESRDTFLKACDTLMRAVTLIPVMKDGVIQTYKDGTTKLKKAEDVNYLLSRALRLKAGKYTPKKETEVDEIEEEEIFKQMVMDKFYFEKKEVPKQPYAKPAPAYRAPITSLTPEQQELSKEAFEGILNVKVENKERKFVPFKDHIRHFVSETQNSRYSEKSTWVLSVSPNELYERVIELLRVKDFNNMFISKLKLKQYGETDKKALDKAVKEFRDKFFAPKDASFNSFGKPVEAKVDYLEDQVRIYTNTILNNIRDQRNKHSSCCERCGTAF